MSEQLQAVSGGPGRPGHPELEELAALIDGQCGTAEAARLRAHLASCAECYEVFSETLHLQEDLREEEEAAGDIVPFPFETRRKVWPRWVALAVAAAVVVGVGLGAWHTFGGTPDLSVAQLATPLAGQVADLDKSTWGERTRGGKPQKEEKQFRIGVEILNLQVALEAGKQQTADSAAAEIWGLLDASDFPEPGAKDFYKQMRLDLTGGKKPRDLAPSAATEAEALRRSPSMEGPELELGMWAAAGRLAAIHQVPAFFQGKQAKYLLGKLQDDKDADHPPEVVKALEIVDAARSKETLTASDYSRLKTALEQILDHYYGQGHPFDG
jgi:hypothetical protein